MAALDLLRDVAAKHDRILFMQGLGNPSISRAHRDGYINLYAISSDTRVYRGPFNNQVRYLYGDPRSTHFPNSFFKAVVLEDTQHDKRGAVWQEAERIVQDGGAIVSPDGTVEKVEKPGPVPVGELDILLTVWGQGGITEYSQVLRERILREWKVKVSVRASSADVEAEHVLVQFENGLPNASRIISDALDLASAGRSVYFDTHSAFSDFGAWNGYLPELEVKTKMLYRANEVAEADSVSRYYLFPHLSYLNVPELPPRSLPLRLGSFGFAARGKRHEELILATRRLRVPLRLLLSINTEVSEKVAEDMSGYVASLQRRSGRDVEVVSGFFSYEEIERRLADCSHLIFTTKSALSNSGSIQLAKRLNKPILSLESFQAQQAQVHQFACLTGGSRAIGMQLVFASSRLKYALRERPEMTARLLKSLLRRETRGAVARFGARSLMALLRTASSRREPISRGFLEAHTELSRDEDGLQYLYNVIHYPDPLSLGGLPAPGQATTGTRRLRLN